MQRVEVEVARLMQETFKTQMMLSGIQSTLNKLVTKPDHEKQLMEMIKRTQESEDNWKKLSTELCTNSATPKK